MATRRYYEEDRDYLTMPLCRSYDHGPKSEYAMPLKVAGAGHLLEKMWDEKRATKKTYVDKVVKIETNKSLENRAAFINSTTLHCQMAQLKREVEIGLKRAEEDLDSKRNKLKNIVLNEQSKLVEEYADKVQNYFTRIFEEKKKRADEIVKRNSEMKGDEAKEKLEQWMRENSEELRERISKVKRMEAAEIQRHQICEKMIQKQRENEFDNYWLEMQKKRDEEKLRYEEEEERERLMRIKEQRKVLNQQILGKKLMKDEMKKITEKEAVFVDELRQLLREEEEEERKYKAVEKGERMKIQQEQLEEYRRLLEERRLREKEIDDYYRKKLEEAILEDKLKETDTRAEQKKEAEFYMQQLKEIRRVQAEEERQIEEMRRQEVQKKEAEVRKNQLVLKEAKDKLHRETLETWKEQLAHKQRVQMAEKEAEKTYHDWSGHLFDVNRDLDRLKTENKRDTEKDRIKDLEWQQKYEKVLEKRRNLEDDEFLKDNAEEEKKRHEIMESFGTCFGPPHPFTKVIYDNQ